jgi:hypothetical protein
MEELMRVIELKYQGTCRDCGANLPAGTTAKWYGRGRVYCYGEHGGAKKEPTFKELHGRCEDAPCCGCCGENVYGGYDDYSRRYW